MRRLRKTSSLTRGGTTAPHVNDNKNSKNSASSSSSSSCGNISIGGQTSGSSVHIVRPTVTSSIAQISANSSGGGSVRFKSNNMENGGAAGGMTMLAADVYKNFDKTGRSEFLRYIKQQLKEANGPIFDRNNEFKASISGAIYDLLWHAIRSTIKKDLVLSVLTDVVTLHEDFHSMILDIVNVLDAETSLMADGLQEERVAFVQLVKDLDRVVPDKLIKERLEIDTLQDVGIVKHKLFYTKFIKIKTKLYYKQRRFNLFREESEGYAKLITELNVDFEEDVTAESFMDIIKSLIGCFNLDPNRVLDIIIESFEMRPECCQIFIPLLRSYMPTSSIICEVLGYKFRYYADTKTPKSLYHVCALLLKNGVIELNDIYVWLNPTDRSIAQEWELQLQEAKEYVRKLNVIITNKDKEPAEQEPEREYTEEQYNANQKFGLCESLLKVGDWHNAAKIIRKLPEQCVLVHEPIARALCQLVHLSIEHVYMLRCFKPPNTVARNAGTCSKLADDVKIMQKLQARDFSELRLAAFPMVTVLGPSLHFDSVLMFKLVRILRTILSEMGVNTLNAPTPHTDAETLYYEVMSILDAAILPALSYMDSNCPMAEEIMTVLKYYPYHFRYSLYARWKNESYLINPKLIRRRGNAQKSIKALMKRVSKENVKPVGRHMGKLSHCAPGFLFDYILLQIQIYDNLIGPVVDSFKYLTSLSFDCLSYCLIEALAMADRNRIKHDGTSISLWLQSLANFCGAIYKKYNIELSGLLQFVANQLKMQKSLDLLILKEIVQKMAGVESAEEMTNEQLNAMCGGELLRGEAGYFSQVRNTKKSSQRLKDALAYNDLAVTICLLMAQQKHCVIYRETAQSHLKLVGKLYDQCQDTLVQFGTFLGSSYSVDEYVDRLPSIITMLQDYHINADVAFFLARPMFSHQINIKYDQLRKADPNAKKLTTLQKQAKYLDAINYVMNPIIESVRPLHGPKVWEDISPQFLVTFWSLSMYDLQVPSESYQKEISKLKLLSQQAIESKDSNASKNKKEQERFVALMEKLQDERRKQQEHVDKTLQRLQHQKDNWFLSRSAKSAKNETITQFLQLCLFPRCTFTALDALYCAKFVHTIHNLKANNFSTLLCYDRIFCDITYSVTSCTENEATRYGRFLCALLETVMRWHADQSTFNRECANYPGFVTKFRVSNQFSEANDHVGYENYRHVCHKWHYKITKAIVFCLDSKEYMQIRNALIILMRILPYYPVLVKLANIIERKVEKVREEEKNKRPDLFAIASSYIGQLKTRAAHMIIENDFHQVIERTQRTDSTPSSNTANAATSAATITTQTASTTTNITTLAGTTSAINANNNNNNSTLSNVVPTKASNSTTVPSTSAATSTTIIPSNQQTTNVNSAQSQSTATNNNTNNIGTSNNNIGTTTTLVSTKVSNGDLKNEKRDKERSEKTKMIKVTSTSNINNEKDALSSNDNGGNNNSNNNNNNNSTSIVTNSSSGSNTRNTNNSIPILELREEANINEREQRERERDRERFANSRSMKELSKKERERERERERYHRTEDNLEGSLAGSGGGSGGNTSMGTSGNFTPTRIKRDKRREERYRAESPTDIDVMDNVVIDKHHDYERDQRARDRDLSSVSNESNGSLQRRSQEMLEYEKDSKRRKMEQPSTSKKQTLPEEMLENVKKERGVKNKERKDKMTDEEKETRKERKLGRKRERLEESGLAEHKRRREILNGEDDVRDRSDKYHPRESPHMRDVRERSHEKFDRSDRNTRGSGVGGGAEDRQYGPAKSTRSRINY